MQNLLNNCLVNVQDIVLEEDICSSSIGNLKLKITRIKIKLVFNDYIRITKALK